jgi:DNA-binding protein YbaB
VVYDVDAAEDWLESWSAGVSAQAQQAAELARRVAALTGHAESRDASIKVTVGASGQIEGLELDDSVRQLSGERLARQILSVMRSAQAHLSRQVADEVQATVGADTQAGRAVIQSYGSRFPKTSDGEDSSAGRRER